MDTMQKMVQDKLDDLSKSEDYECLKCGKTYDLLTAMTMTDPRIAPTGVFVCCRSEMQQQTHEEDKRSLSSLNVRLRDLLEEVQNVYDRVIARAKAEREEKEAQDFLGPRPSATLPAVKRPLEDTPPPFSEGRRDDEVKKARLEDGPAMLQPVERLAQEVFVAGKRYYLTDVQENDDLLDEMTQEEFEAYQDIINS